MKKILYNVVLFMSFSLLLSSCGDDMDYKAMNITHLEEEIDIKEFVGDLTSEIIVKNAAGEVVDNVDMGETFYVIDNTMDGVTDRTWTITQNGVTTTSTEKFIRMVFPKPGDVTFSLESSRSTDNKSVTSSEVVKINVIPVEADYLTVPEPVDGVVNILLGESIELKSVVKGSPTEFNWTATGPETFTASGATSMMQFTEVGDFDLALDARREDAPGEWVNDVETKAGYVKVSPVDFNLYRAIITDSEIELRFGYGVEADVAALKDAISIKIETASKGTITPEIVSVASHESDLSKVVVTMSDKMYSDDKVFITIAEGAIKDMHGLTSFPGATDYPATYGHNLWNNDFYGMESNPEMWVATDKPTVTVTDEKSYTGLYSLKLESSGGEWTMAEIQGDGRRAQLDASKTYKMEWKMWIDPDKYHNVLGPWLCWDNGAGAQQFWTGMNGMTKGEWVTVTKTIDHAKIKGDKNVHMRVRIKENCLIYIDDWAIYEVNPRP